MRKEKKSTFIFVVLLGVIMMFNLLSCNVVCAADEDDSIWPSPANNTNTNTNTNTSSIDDDDDDWGSIENEIINETNTSNSVVTNNTTNNSTNNTVKVNTSNTTNNSSTIANKNSLAKTGIEDSKGIVAIVLVVSGIVAIYSFRKVQEYKNM